MKKRFTDSENEIVKIYYPHKKKSNPENIIDFQNETDDVKIWTGKSNNIFTD